LIKTLIEVLSEEIERPKISEKCRGCYSALSMASIKDWAEEVQDYVIGTSKIKDLTVDYENFERILDDECLLKVFEKRSMDYDTRGALKAAQQIKKGQTCPPSLPLSTLYPVCKSMGESWFKEFGWVYNNEKIDIDAYNKDGKWYSKKSIMSIK